MDDTQTTSPATQEENAQTPIAGEDAPNRQPEAPNGQSEAPSGPPGFSERGRMRRRMRFLRKARELAYRDLGGLVFDLHRFGRRNDTLVLAKLETIGRIDTELRALEDTLAERRGVTVLREAGVAACPRCAAIHGSDDRFCPNCGLAMDLRAERPMAGPQTAAPTPPAPTPPSPPAPMPAAVPAPAPAGSPAPSRTAVSTATATTPAPSTPNPMATPVPADTPPSTSAPAPEQGAIAPSKPAPVSDRDPAPAETRPNVEEPTEIVRPSVEDP